MKDEPYLPPTAVDPDFVGLNAAAEKLKIAPVKLIQVLLKKGCEVYSYFPSLNGYLPLSLDEELDLERRKRKLSIWDTFPVPDFIPLSKASADELINRNTTDDLSGLELSLKLTIEDPDPYLAVRTADFESITSRDIDNSPLKESRYIQKYNYLIISVIKTVKHEYPNKKQVGPITWRYIQEKSRVLDPDQSIIDEVTEDQIVFIADNGSKSSIAKKSWSNKIFELQRDHPDMII